ncbi:MULTISPECIES: peptidylprolyl isomerase [unclassified Nocardioides]|uniref:peptidylprolyl isomerase n=1 Tax=unclassified Nocardioides TaxID=2615069 RepID=UPI0006F3182C|nr:MULTISPECIES: peptidylprolyl isomerase [unclassified Nocardioides]KRA28099.1 hypothetical protein ASD81_23330 [Nocardioides sp. Root614]KRA86074.1 hypothetical protein ASD84_23570 [Nocardioides sp. Root682]
MRSRLLAGVPALLLLASLAACGDDDTKAADDSSTTDPSSDTTTESTGAASGSCDFVETGGAAREVKLPKAAPSRSGQVPAVLHTTVGDLKLTLDADKAPCTVESFASLAEQGYYDNTSCHRQGNDPGFEFLQCGDPNFDPKAATPGQEVGSGGPGYTIPDEITGDETYPAGTLAMANTGAPNSGGGQFFIVFGDSGFSPAYTVWGKLDDASLKTLLKATASGNDDYWTSIGSSGGRPNTPVTFKSITIG